MTIGSVWYTDDGLLPDFARGFTHIIIHIRISVLIFSTTLIYPSRLQKI